MHILAYIAFLSGNFGYEYFQEVPNYCKAANSCLDQIFAILFTVYYQKSIPK